MASSNIKRASLRQRLGEIIADVRPMSDADVGNVELLNLVIEEGVQGLVWQKMTGVSDLNINHDMKASLTARLHEMNLRYLRMQHACGRILATLHQSNIQVICMRGVAVTEMLYAEKAALRPISDIDLLIDERQMLDAKQALWDIGFRPDSQYSNIYARGDIPIDLHHEPLGIERIRTWEHLTPLRIDDFLKYAQEGELVGEESLLLHPRVNLPYLCFHALKHSFERLIWLYDIALLANEVDQSDQWDEILEGIQEYKLERPCFYALSYVKEHLGAQVPDHVLEIIRPKMGFVERSLFRRFMKHEIIPFLAERLFARMQPDFSHRLHFWRETIYPRYEVRKQMVQSGCVKCNFIRKRLKQLIKAAWLFVKEGVSLIRV